MPGQPSTILNYLKKNNSYLLNSIGIKYIEEWWSMFGLDRHDNQNFYYDPLHVI